ncbi:LPD38 domain-containing protein [Bacillus sp. GeD10]|uniref:LPD38 domain-containing protein n=1 Tax=Bacillus sp. GeD10 TaxID=1301086 RepID=UPI0002D21D13|nr:LPD38 domain-containing protein [Bacillus sp. GeD10]CCW05445.1 hypothetical protein EBGED10_21720 [Bacillus sp. GeD10]
MPRKKKSDIEREQASSMVNDWERANGGLDDNQRATLQRMIELNSNTAQQDIRRVDYYSGNQDKYEKNTQPIQVRNENTGNLVKKKKEIFALKEGQEEEPLENVYQSLEFDKNNEDHRKPPERNPFLDQIKAANSISQSTSTDWMKQQEEASRTNRMMSTIDRIAKQPPQEGGFFDDLKFGAKKFGEMIKPPEGKTRQEVWDEYMKDGGKSRGTKEVNRFANRTMDSTLLNAPSATMKKVRGQDAVDWQDHREGVGENIADFVSTGIGYVLPGAGAAQVAGKLGMAAKVGENTSRLGKIGQYAKEGAVTGALIAGAETPAKAYVNPEQTVGDHLKRIGVETAAGAAITPLVHELGNAIKSLRKTKGDTSNVSDDVMQQERHQRELTNQAVEEQALQHTRIKNEPESLPIQAASESAPSLEQAIESVAKQKKKASSNGELPDDVQAMRNAPPVIQSAMAPDGRTITQKKLMDSFRDNLGITLRTGRMGVGDDAVSGIYKNSPEVIRTRDYGDLETLAHETGHHLDKKFGLNDPKFDDELMKLGSHTSGQNYTPEQIRQEGMAEFMRRYLLNPAMAEQEAPAFMKHFQNTIPKDVQKGLQKVQEDAQIWANQGDDMRFRGRINSEEQPKGLERVKQMLSKDGLSKAYTELVDRFHPISRAEKEILGGQLADGSESAYKKATLAAGAPRIAEQRLEGLKNIMKPLENSPYKLQDVSDYLAAVHANDLSQYGKRMAEEATTDASQIVKDFKTATPESIAMDMKEFEKKYGIALRAEQKQLASEGKSVALHPEQVKQIEDAFHIETGFKPEEIQSVMNKYGSDEMMKGIQKSVVDYNNSLLDTLVDSQMLSKDAVAAMREKHPNYVPFYRSFDEEATAGLGSGKGFVDLTNPVKRMKGSTRNVINPMESILKNTFATVQAAEKNKVGLALANLAEKEGAGKWIEKLAGDGKESVGKENIVTVFRNGEKQQYQLEPELYRAVKAMDKEITNKIVKVLAKPTDMLRAGATLTPEFPFRNFFRDQFHAYAVSDVGYNPFDFVKGLKEVGKKKFGKGSEMYDDWVNQGGAYGGYLSADRDILQEQVKEFSKDGGTLQRAVQAIKDPREWIKPLQLLSEMSEEATKVGAYQKGLKKGLTPEESAYQAKDIMNFNRVGNSTQSANRILEFLNANLQGKDKLIRTMIEHPIRTTARIAGSTLPPSAIAYGSYQLANEEQKEILDNMPQWERDAYWPVAVPGTDKVARLPKPFDMNLLPNTAERAVKYIEGDKYAFDGYSNTLADTVAMPYIPTYIKSPIENMTNHSFFTDSAIVPQRDQSNSPRNQYGPNTSLTAREIGDALNISPYKIDNLYKGYTAGLGQIPLKASDAAISLVSDKEMATKPAQGWHEDYPVAKAFFSNGQGGGKAVDDYYNVLQEQKAIEADTKDRKEDAPNKAEMDALKPVEKQLKDLRKEYRELKEDTEISPEMKRAEMDRINKEMRVLAREGLQIFKPGYK